MKPEISEKLFIEDLFEVSKEKISQTIELETIDCLTGDASSRRYHRLFTNEGTFVVCLDHPTESGYHDFVEAQKYFEKHDIRVPKIFDVNLERGYILQEDLGDLTLLQHLAGLGSVKEEYNIYEGIVDQLIKLHKIDMVKSPNENLFSRKFDVEKYMSEIEFTYKFFFKNFLKVDDDKAEQDFLNFYQPICERLAKQKMVVTHRDFHSRNIMLKQKELVIIDFQDARPGIPQYDLVSLLEDSYYDLMGENKKNLIKYYYENLPQEIHHQGSFEDFYLLYKDMLLQRAIKAIGSFSYIYELRKDVRYVKYIGYTLEKIRKTMMDDKRYDSLRLLLSQKYYES